MTLTFGTDGVRGRAYDELTVADVEALGQAAGLVLGGDAIVIGTDGRDSGDDFVGALCRAFHRDGIRAWNLGLAPTPAVAHVAAEHGIAGAMVSASHNPYHDNGVKFFAPGGRKLTDAQQAAIEAELADLAATPSSLVDQPGSAVGPVDRTDLVADYVDWVVGTVPPGALSGLRVIADCANGAASGTAVPALRRLGAEVTAINDAPDGRNINADCGSTDMTRLSREVVAGAADLGLAFDGDADRMLAIDRDGQTIDGDQIIAICARDLHERGRLADDTVVVTVMTNLGFRLGMAEAGVEVHETPVGDRHVLEALERHGWTLGGEQSGHVIFHELATTGDGLLSAVQLLEVVNRSGRPLAELADATMTRLPQRLRNVGLSGPAVEAMEAIAADIADVEARLGSTGRLLVRPSGTEPLIRVMAEAPTQRQADEAVDQLIAALEACA